MEPWYKVVTPRKEVREGRSFNPDEFAIALDQVVAKRAPADYQDPVQFFSRTCFTQALCENSGMVLRRLAGRTDNAAPVQTLITQMGGGKTHMLTTLWHLANGGEKTGSYPGVAAMMKAAGLSKIPDAKVAVYVGTAWDPQEGSETPWIHMARQLAGEEGVRALGPRAKEDPPGSDTLNRVFELAGGRVLLLFDEVLNGFSRHKWLAEPMHAFFHVIVRTLVGSHEKAAVFSLPRSQVEMTDFDLTWQNKIVKEIGAVAKPLLVNDEAEISEVIRQRLFENLGSDRIRRNVAKAYADWCFERRAQLPPEWTAVDTSATEKKAREFLQGRFEACYPFHPATLSVFHRKWMSLPQFQATRGTLAMLAQWISWSFRESHVQARREPLITLGSAPLHDSGFCSVVLGQLGENRLNIAIDTDIAGDHSHARALDADTKGSLREIHRRVGAAILFESSGGQRDKVAHLPELRFALGEPELDTTSIDTASITLDGKSFFIQRVGADGFKLYHRAKIDKAVHDRRASLDEDTEIQPAIRKLVREEFKRGASIPTELFEPPLDTTKISDTPRLAIWVVDPDEEWNEGGPLRERIADWTKNRGKSARLYPGALVWCVRKPGRDLRDKVELWLAWKRVQKDVREGVLGTDYEKADLRDIEASLADAEEQAKDEVWGGYRFVVLADSADASGLKIIDLGAGHSSGSETLCGRIIGALKAEALLNESVGAGYIDRNWPPAFKDTGAWPLASLRQSFLNGALTRLLDPDAILRGKIVEFVSKGDFGLASGPKPDGTYERLWHRELMPADEVSFEPGVLLIKKSKVEALKKPPETKKPDEEPAKVKPPGPDPDTETGTEPELDEEAEPDETTLVPTSTPIRVAGQIPPEQWNRLGTRIVAKLRSHDDFTIEVVFSASVDGTAAGDIKAELRQALADLGLEDSFTIE
jgi:hypothetical protein